MSRLRTQAGFTLIEVLVAWSVLLIGIVGTLHAFAGSQRGTAKAEQRARMVVIAQREIERLRGLPYAQLGLVSLPPASTEAPRVGASATEALVEGGVVDSGPTPFDSQGITGRIYRYVTWRPQSCPLLTAKVGTEIDTQAGVSGSGQAEAALGNLCPGDRHTKRVVVAVVADDPRTPGTATPPYRAQTIMADTATGVLPNPAALAVDRNGDAAHDPDVVTAQERLYENSRTQTLYLYDTPCTFASRQPPASHPTRDTARKDDTCSGTEHSPDLMATAAPSGVGTNDFSTDLVRSPADGLTLKQDDRASSCTADVPYEASDAAIRQWSVHRWSTRPLAAPAETLAGGGRATLTLFTHSVGGAVGSGRLCVVIRRTSTGELLGSEDFRLAQWPTTTTQLAISFDLAPAALAAGERLTVIVRNHPDSDNDIELLYDSEDAPSSLSLTMTAGKEIQ